MIRQARKYMVGAASSVTLVSVAVVVFVVLVSAQVFRDWPIGVLGGDEKAAVASADAVGGTPDSAPGAAKTVIPGSAPRVVVPSDASRDGTRTDGGERIAAPEDNTSVGSSAPPVDSSEPVESGSSDSGSAGDESGQSSPSAPSESGMSSDSSSPGGGQSSSSGNGSGSNGSGNGSSNSGGGAKPPTKVVEEVVEPVTSGSGSTAAKVTETVNSTVNSVDETVTGGALEETGVTGLTEEVVNGVAGPESVVGKTVDEVGKAVGGLLGGQH